MLKISDDQLDLLKEVFNLGVGRAAASLSSFANNKYEVILSLPKVQVITINEMIKILENESNNKITSVYQKYSGPFNGTAHMIYSQASSLRLVSLMLDSQVPEDLISELESDALTEIGNVLINACLGSLSKMFNVEIETELPNIISGAPLLIFSSMNNNLHEEVTFIRSEFYIKEENLKGNISLFLETGKIEKILDLINRFNEELMA